MAWRPYENLIDGELTNRVPGKVTGWIRFFRIGQEPLKVLFDLDGDFHDDIRGKIIRLRNPNPSDRNASLGRPGTYMEGFAPIQRGDAGDITAGLSLGPWTRDVVDALKTQLETIWQASGISGAKLREHRQEVDQAYQAKIDAGELRYAYVDYPYIEWYSDNGRVVLELDASQVEIDSSHVGPLKEKTPVELFDDRRRRSEAFRTFVSRIGGQLAGDENAG